MIVNERLTAYLHSLDSGESEIIEAIGGRQGLTESRSSDRRRDVY